MDEIFKSESEELRDLAFALPVQQDNKAGTHGGKTRNA